ncbi:MAG: hypothetical protein HXY44_17560 [Syntrophaceae bacterium]|nr:hypothetical protein [Syntrophaceae bacterium]
MKLELIQIDCYGLKFGINRHFCPLKTHRQSRRHYLIKNKEKNLTVRTIRNCAT